MAFILIVIITKNHYNNIGEINAKSATYVPFYKCPGTGLSECNKLALAAIARFSTFPMGKATKFLWRGNGFDDVPETYFIKFTSNYRLLLYKSSLFLFSQNMFCDFGTKYF